MSEQQQRNETSRGFRKRRILVPVCLLVAVAGAYGFYAFATAASDMRAWDRTADSAAEFENDLEWQEEADRLESLGYLGGRVPVPDQVGVTIHRPAEVHAGMNLYTSTADFNTRLMDMSGHVVHTWRLEITALPSYQGLSEHAEIIDGFAKMNIPVLHARVFDNGDLLILYRRFGLVKLDKNSRVLWQNEDTFHHDLDLLPDGRIYVLALKILPRRVSKLWWNKKTQPTRLDFIVLLDPEGKELKRISVLEAFERSKYRHVLRDMPDDGDITHSNELAYLDGSLSHISPLYKRGNLLISCREINTIAIVDPEIEKVVWAAQGPWKSQHSPVLLEDGNMLLFDNRGLGWRSRVIQFDPKNQSINWVYGEKPSQQFYSSVCGMCQRLPNGNTLITASTLGKAFEVTPQQEVVWEFVCPLRYEDKVATLFQVHRLPQDFPLDWIEDR